MPLNQVNRPTNTQTATLALSPAAISPDMARSAGINFYAETLTVSKACGKTAEFHIQLMLLKSDYEQNHFYIFMMLP